MRIGLAYNEKPDPAPDAASDSASDAFAEWDDPSTIAAVEQALGLFGSVIRLEADQFFPQNLVLARPDLVFNMAEGLHGQSREALVPAICEYLNIPYTGSDPLTLALSLHKGRTKETLAYRGVPTAPFTCIEAPGQIERMALTYPVRSEEHTSELQSRSDLVCRLLLEKKKKRHTRPLEPLMSSNLAKISTCS